MTEKYNPRGLFSEFYGIFNKKTMYDRDVALKPSKRNKEKST